MTNNVNRIKLLSEKRFKIVVGGEVERSCNFLGLLGVLHRFSDFFSYTPAEQRTAVNEWLSSRRIYVDANITATF